MCHEKSKVIVSKRCCCFRSQQLKKFFLDFLSLGANNFQNGVLTTLRHIKNTQLPSRLHRFVFALPHSGPKIGKCHGAVHRESGAMHWRDGCGIVKFVLKDPTQNLCQEVSFSFFIMTFLTITHEKMDFLKCYS